jgi:hypothetical protein
MTTLIWIAVFCVWVSCWVFCVLVGRLRWDISLLLAVAMFALVPFWTLATLCELAGGMNPIIFRKKP